MNYLLIPGNPPAVYFYQLWQREILQQQANSQVKVSPYPQLSPMADSARAMGIVTAAHAQQLEQFYFDTKQPITIIGHSLGGYFALKLLEQQSDLIEKVILIHPFLRKPDLRGQIILKTAKSFYHSKNLQRLVLKSRKWIEYLSSDLPLVSNEELLNSFQLVQHENAVIASDDSSVYIDPKFRDKVQVFYTQQDSWCQPKVVTELQAQAAVICCAEPHGFITEEKHRRSLFKKIQAI